MRDKRSRSIGGVRQMPSAVIAVHFARSAWRRSDNEPHPIMTGRVPEGGTRDPLAWSRHPSCKCDGGYARIRRAVKTNRRHVQMARKPGTHLPSTADRPAFPGVQQAPPRFRFRNKMVGSPAVPECRRCADAGRHIFRLRPGPGDNFSTALRRVAGVRVHPGRPAPRSDRREMQPHGETA